MSGRDDDGGGDNGSGGSRGSSRRRKLLSEDDRTVWDFVARKLEPARGKSRVRDVEPDWDAIVAEVEASRPKLSGKAPARAASPARAVPPRQAAVAPPVPAAPLAPPSPPAPQHVKLERRKARRIARGSDDIEARLDLHGMTQDDAHYALIGFVRRCHAQGLRTVLVITGKGGASRDDGGDVIPRARGVLKRNVPRWLAGAEIGTLVVSYTTAHVRHGGEGALYVRLRRND